MQKKAQLSNLKAGLFVILLVTLIVAAGLTHGKDRITGMSGLMDEITGRENEERYN